MITVNDIRKAFEQLSDFDPVTVKKHSSGIIIIGNSERQFYLNETTYEKYKEALRKVATENKVLDFTGIVLP